MQENAKNLKLLSEQGQRHCQWQSGRGNSGLEKMLGSLKLDQLNTARVLGTHKDSTGPVAATSSMGSLRANKNDPSRERAPRAAAAARARGHLPAHRDGRRALAPRPRPLARDSEGTSMARADPAECHAPDIDVIMSHSGSLRAPGPLAVASSRPRAGVPALQAQAAGAGVGSHVAATCARWRRQGGSP